MDRGKLNEKLDSLFTKYQSGDEDLISQIILIGDDEIDIVYNKVCGYYKADFREDKRDLRQEGRMGVFNAAKTYDKKRFPNVTPLTHIHNKCLATMVQFVRSYSVYRFSISDMEDSNINGEKLMVGFGDSKDILDTMIMEETIRAAVSTLSSREKQVINFKYWWNLYNKDVANHLGISKHTVSLRNRTAKNKIRKIITEIMDGDVYNDYK